MGHAYDRQTQQKPRPRTDQHHDTPPEEHERSLPSLSSQRTIALLLREAAGRSNDALRLDDERARTLEGMRAAHTIVRATAEVLELVRMQEVDWRQLRRELQAFLVAAAHVAPILRAQFESTSNEVEAAAMRLQAVVTPEVFAAARSEGPAMPLPATTDADRVEIVGAALAAASRDAESGTSTIRVADRRAAVFSGIAVHLRTARTTFERVSNRSIALTMNPAMAALKARLDRLEQALQVEPAVEWELEIASAFDIEADLRKSFGLAPADRAYSGRRSPAQAAQIAIGRATSSLAAMDTSVEYSTPQAAVGAIEAGFIQIYEAQHRLGVQRFASDISEPIVAPKSVFDVILDLVVEVALGAMTGGIGSLVGAAVTSALRNTVTRSALAGRGSMSSELRDEVLEHAMADSALYRGVVTDSARDATKSFVRNLSVVGRSAGAKRTNAQDPRNAFIQRLDAALVAAKGDTTRFLPELRAALLRLDLADLASLARHIWTIPPEAAALQYDVAMREWQNTRALLAAPGTSGDDPNLVGAGRLHGEESIDGVLEVGLSVSADRKPTLDYMTVRNAEPAAVRHLRDHPRPLVASGLNRMYQFNFGGWPQTSVDNARIERGLPSAFVKLGVGVRGGFQRGSLSPAELVALKMYAARSQPSLGRMVLAEMTDSYSMVPDDVAIAVALALIATADRHSTKDLA